MAPDGSDLFLRLLDRFNAGVESGDFSPMVELFTPDAELRFEGIAVGPFLGRDAIATAYAEQPPDDQVLAIGPPVVAAGRVEAPYAWRAAPDRRAGVMRVELSGAEITRLTVTFE